MKRIHLFEFEDCRWFPRGLRDCMTRYLMLLHRLLGTCATLVEQLRPILLKMGKPEIVDLCSGSGGPMLAVAEALGQDPGLAGLHVTLTDLYPNPSAAASINAVHSPCVEYRPSPLDASHVDSSCSGLRTMICSLHHARPAAARRMLDAARRSRQPFFAYELSDNSFPRALFWLAVPFNIIAVMFLTPLVRPLSWQQLVFTYLVPVLPVTIAWDGAVSNARTYTLDDMKELLRGLDGDDYGWTMGALPGKGGRTLYLLGLPRPG